MVQPAVVSAESLFYGVFLTQTWVLKWCTPSPTSCSLFVCLWIIFMMSTVIVFQCLPLKVDWTLNNNYLSICHWNENLNMFSKFRTDKFWPKSDQFKSQLSEDFNLLRLRCSGILRCMIQSKCSNMSSVFSKVVHIAPAAVDDRDAGHGQCFAASSSLVFTPPPPFSSQNIGC